MLTMKYVVQTHIGFSRIAQQIWRSNFLFQSVWSGAAQRASARDVRYRWHAQLRIVNKTRKSPRLNENMDQTRIWIKGSNGSCNVEREYAQSTQNVSKTITPGQYRCWNTTSRIPRRFCNTTDRDDVSGAHEDVFASLSFLNFYVHQLFAKLRIKFDTNRGLGFRTHTLPSVAKYSHMNSFDCARPLTLSVSLFEHAGLPNEKPDGDTVTLTYADEYA